MCLNKSGHNFFMVPTSHSLPRSLNLSGTRLPAGIILELDRDAVPVSASPSKIKDLKSSQ